MKNLSSFLDEDSSGASAGSQTLESTPSKSISLVWVPVVQQLYRLHYSQLEEDYLKMA